MVYLLDTCALSDYIKGNCSTTARFKAEKPSNIHISAITKFEIEYGLQLKPSLIKQVSAQLEGIYKKTKNLDFATTKK